MIGVKIISIFRDGSKKRKLNSNNDVSQGVLYPFYLYYGNVYFFMVEACGVDS